MTKVAPTQPPELDNPALNSCTPSILDWRVDRLTTTPAQLEKDAASHGLARHPAALANFRTYGEIHGVSIARKDERIGLLYEHDYETLESCGVEVEAGSADEDLISKTLMLERLNENLEGVRILYPTAEFGIVCETGTKAQPKVLAFIPESALADMNEQQHFDLQESLYCLGYPVAGAAQARLSAYCWAMLARGKTVH